MNAELLTTQPVAWRLTTTAPDGQPALTEVVDADLVDERRALRLAMTAIYPGWTVHAEPVT